MPRLCRSRVTSCAKSEFFITIVFLFIHKPINIRRGESGGRGVGRAFRVARVLFIWLPSWGNTTTPHPAGDPKGPPNPTSSSLAPHIISGRAERLSRASDLQDWWKQWENLCVPPLACACKRQ